MNEAARSRSSSPHASSSPSPPYRATVSEDSDDYEHLSKPEGTSTSASMTAHNVDSEGLRERNRTPYSVSSPSSVPKKEDVLPSLNAASLPDQAPSSSANASSGSAISKGKQKAEQEDEVKQEDTIENPFACHICLEVPAADDAVLSKCGHLFCWSDLSAWLESNPPTTSQCPVCKSQIKDIQEDVIPIYSGGGGASGKKQVDPRTKPRPKPRVQPAPAPSSSSMNARGLGGWQGAGGPFGPYWDMGGPTAAAAGPSGWSVQAGVFPFPGLSLGWSGGTRPVHLAGPRGMTMGTYAGIPPGVPMTPEMQEAARRQQRNALIAFVVMIILFSLLATVGEMDEY